MTHSRCIALVASIWWGSFGASAQSPFEGIIESTNLTTDEMGTPQKYIMTMSVKGGMVRVDIPSYGSTPGTALIYRRDLKCVWVLNDTEKSYFEMRQEASGTEGITAESPQIRRSGKTKKILGYPCDQLLMKAGDAETEFWGTKKLGALAKSITLAIEAGGEEGGGVMNDELASMGYFPLIARTKLQGVVVESSEVTKIEGKHLEPALFEVPKDYRKQSMQEIFQGGAP
jgi:hypothetical protein